MVNERKGLHDTKVSGGQEGVVEKSKRQEKGCLLMKCYHVSYHHVSKHMLLIKLFQFSTNFYQIKSAYNTCCCEHFGKF